MSDDTQATVRIHRFRDSVALHAGEGETVYIAPADARALFQALGKMLRSIEKESYGDSNDLTHSVPCYSGGRELDAATEKQRKRF